MNRRVLMHIGVFFSLPFVSFAVDSVTKEDFPTTDAARTIQVPYFEDGKFKGYIETSLADEAGRTPSSLDGTDATVEPSEEAQHKF